MSRRAVLVGREELTLVDLGLPTVGPEPPKVGNRYTEEEAGELRERLIQLYATKAFQKVAGDKYVWGRGDVDEVSDVVMDDLISGKAIYDSSRAAVRDCLTSGGATHDSSRAAVRRWLYGIVRHKVMDWVRGKIRVSKVFERFAFECRTYDVSAEVKALEALEILEAAGAVTKIKEALARLSESDREVLRLRFTAALPFNEIGRSLGIEEGAAKVRCFRAIKRLRARYEEVA